LYEHIEATDHWFAAFDKRFADSVFQGGGFYQLQ